MPIYDYYCESCDRKFETYHHAMDDDPEECQMCGSMSERTQHFHAQNLKRPDYIPPPKASRKFGEEKVTPHVRKRWH